MDTSSFWKLVAESYWDRAPFALTNSPLQLDVAEDLIFDAFQHGCAARHQYPLFRVTVAIDGRPLLVDVDDELPTASDPDLATYLERMDRRHADHDWSVAVSGLHSISATLWERAKRLSDELVDNVGPRPDGHVDVDMFLGRYASTSVGIHADAAHNFGFTLKGPKRLLTWSAESADRIPRHTLDYEAARDSAHILNGAPGTLTYFPATEFHVGESPERATASVNIAFFVEADPLQKAVSAVAEAAHSEYRAPAYPRPEGTSSRTVTPPAFSSALARLAEVTSDGSAEAVMNRQWLRSVTSSGLDVPRPTREVTPFGEGVPVAMRPGARLACLHSEVDSGWLVSSQGHVATLPDVPGLSGLLDGLAGGKALSVLDATAALQAPGEQESAGDSGPDETARRVATALLHRLCVWGAAELTED